MSALRVWTRSGPQHEDNDQQHAADADDHVNPVCIGGPEHGSGQVSESQAVPDHPQVRLMKIGTEAIVQLLSVEPGRDFRVRFKIAAEIPPVEAYFAPTSTRRSIREADAAALAP